MKGCYRSVDVLKTKFIYFLLTLYYFKLSLSILCVNSYTLLVDILSIKKRRSFYTPSGLNSILGCWILPLVNNVMLSAITLTFKI